MVKIAINGFGRIGRAFFKLALTKPELEIVAINDLGELKDFTYLLQHDSVYGEYKSKVESQNSDGKNFLVVNEKKFLFLSEKDPKKLPWSELGVDIVIEATGAFEGYEKSKFHLEQGAKRVVITAPAKDEDGSASSPQGGPDGKTVLMGINEDDLKTCSISSNGSCTTNSASPVMQILSEKLGIKKAFLNTVHAYTASQSLIDGPVKGDDLKRERAAGVNIVPSTTGAAIAVTRVIDSLKGRFDGMAMRVPVADGSISAITFVSERQTTAEEINEILKEAEKEPRWRGILKTVSDPTVSTDIIGDPYAAIADLSLTKVVDGDLCTVYSWYDNEFGYTVTLVNHVLRVAKLI